MSRGRSAPACVLLFTKPAHPGRVKTRLIGELLPEQAAELHAAFLGDLTDSLRAGAFDLRVAWALDDHEAVPATASGIPVAGFRQRGSTLGDRLYHGLQEASEHYERVAAVGSDHPELHSSTVEDGFGRLDAAEVVLGPTPDGGYFLIGVRREALHPRLFEGIAWSTDTVLEQTLERCRQLDLTVDLLPQGYDIDVAEDLKLLATRLATTDAGPLRTRQLLSTWGRLDSSETLTEGYG